MLATLSQNSSLLNETVINNASHLLIILPKTSSLASLRGVPQVKSLETWLKRKNKKLEDLAKTPISGNFASGGLGVWVMLDREQSVFEQQTVLRKALQILLEEQPQEITLAVFGNNIQRGAAAELAVYIAWVNSAQLPNYKKKEKEKERVLEKISLYGYRDSGNFADQLARAEGNLLTRSLTMLPPNELTPRTYRTRVKKLAQQYGWKYGEYDMKALRQMKAGAFVAVAQGSPDEDAAIVYLRYRHPKAKRTLALVGKGICFDTGGHNLKPAKYMHGMHEDMNGSAVALGLLLTATLDEAAVNLDVWLAIAQNQLSPQAYKQNEIVTALNGTTIEIIHTDAEGRMVLADTLTLAARAKPDLIIDFATLTGSMHYALGSRYSGVFATSELLAKQAVEAGKKSGERVCMFPMDKDYESALDSKIADIKQCTLEGEADHILAARFLQRFTENKPWVHVDLSASSCSEGLGAVASEVTGFGVNWGITMLREVLSAKKA